MNIVGFNFTNINAERKKSAVGKINISNNVSIKDVKETKIGLGGSRSAVSVHWSFDTKYSPDLATMSFQGEVLLLLEPKRADEVRKMWKEGRRLPVDLGQNVMNHVLDRCHIQALLLSKDLNLPSPVKLPKFQVKQAPGKAPAKAPKKTTVKKK